MVKINKLKLKNKFDTKFKLKRKWEYVFDVLMIIKIGRSHIIFKYWLYLQSFSLCFVCYIFARGATIPVVVLPPSYETRPLFKGLFQSNLCFFMKPRHTLDDVLSSTPESAVGYSIAIRHRLHWSFLVI